MKTHQAFSHALCGLVALLVLAAPCAAQELVAGFEGGPSTGDAFFTPIFRVPLNTTNAVTLKPSASYLYYDTRGKTGQETKISAPGASFGVGYRYTGTDVTFDIGPAFEVLWQTKRPTGKLSTKETLIGVAFAADLYYQATRFTSLNLVATYDQPNRYYWSRATIKERVTDFEFKNSWSMSLGADVTDQGATDVHQLSGGGLVEFDFDKGQTALQLRGGYSWLAFADHTHDQRPYAGATLYHHF